MMEKALYSLIMILTRSVKDHHHNVLIRTGSAAQSMKNLLLYSFNRHSRVPHQHDKPGNGKGLGQGQRNVEQASGGCEHCGRVRARNKLLVLKYQQPVSGISAHDGTSYPGARCWYLLCQHSCLRSMRIIVLLSTRRVSIRGSRT